MVIVIVCCGLSMFVDIIVVMELVVLWKLFMKLNMMVSVISRMII